MYVHKYSDSSKGTQGGEKKVFLSLFFHFIHLLASFIQPHRAINKIKPICQNLMTNIAANVEWGEKLK